MDRRMTVGELVEKLLKIENQETLVVVTSSNFELRDSRIPASMIHQFKGQIKKEGFRDAFDGTDYSTDVVQRNDDGKTDFLEII